MNKKHTGFILFCLGAAGYGLAEILWRGRTHWSMPVAGGICFSVFPSLEKRLKDRGAVIRGIAGGAVITCVEFIFGVIFNIILKRKVWDYSRLPFNICGQICLLYSVIWSVVSAGCIPLAASLARRINSAK